MVADLLTHFFGAQVPAFAGKLHASARGCEQAAEHLDGGCFTRAVGAEQSVDFAVSNLKVHVVDCRE